MPRSCTVCNDTSRLAIDRELVSGGSYSGIARRYGLNSEAVRRHARLHLSRQLVQAYDKKSLTESTELLNRIEDLLTKATTIFNRNFEKGKDALALKALTEQRNTLGLVVNIASALHQARALELELAQMQHQEASRLDVSKLTDEELEAVVTILDKLEKDDGHEWSNMARTKYTFAEPLEEEGEEEEDDSRPMRRTKHPSYRPVDSVPIPGPDGRYETTVARRKARRKLR